MKITVNGEQREIAAATLENALDELGYRNSAVAIAVNGLFVAKSARPEFVLSGGERIEVVAPMQGG